MICITFSSPYDGRNNAISTLYSRLGKTPSIEIAAAYKITVHLAEVHNEDDNVFEHESSLSEADFIVKVWGHIIENLFYKTKVFCRWGDTISETEAADYTSCGKHLSIIFLNLRLDKYWGKSKRSQKE